MILVSKTLEENKNDTQPEERFSQKRDRLEDLRERMEKLREELEVFRKSTQIKDEDYHKLKHDLEYELLLRSGGFVQADDGFVVKRIYPSLEEIFHERPPVHRDLDSINWKTIDNKIYIKEFFEDEADVSEEIARMKEQIEKTKQKKKDKKKGKANFGQNIKVEIPKEFKRDFENFIGENLTLKIGALSIILAIVFGYHTVVKDSISEQARIAVGAFVGAGFFGLSYYLYLKRVSIVSILVAAGIATLYYTVYLATHYATVKQAQFIFTKEQAFVWGLIITSCSVLFSLWYNKKELSYLAFFGGYFTPFLAGFHTESYFHVLLYIFFLNIGFLSISYLKNWRGIHFISFVATLVFVSYWVFNINDTYSNSSEITANVIGLFTFTTVFHVMFFVMLVIFDIKPGVKFTAFDFYMSLTNTVLYLWAGIYLLWLTPASNSEYVGAFMLALSVFKLIYIFLLYGKEHVEKKLLDLQIGAVILFLNIAIYLIFDQNIFFNTLYAIESLGLLWLGIKLKNDIIKTGSVVLVLFAVASMGYAWYLNYLVYPQMATFTSMMPIFNKGFWAAAISFSSLLFTLKFMYEDYKEEIIAYMPKEVYSGILGGLLGIIAYLSILFELLFHTITHDFKTAFVIQIIAFYHFILLVGARFAVYKEKIEAMKLTIGIFMAILIIVYLPFGYFNAETLRDYFINDDLSLFPFIFHYFNVGFSGWIAYLLLIDAANSDGGYLSTKYEYAVLLACGLFIIYTTVEYEHLYVLIKSDSTTTIPKLVEVARLASSTVIWTLLSLLLMYLGMHWKIKEVRKVSLVLFSITILKFFWKDFWLLGGIGKTVAFLVIGTILIVVSQMYRQQLRVLIESGELSFDRDEQLSPEKAEALAKLRKELEELEALEEEGDEESEEEGSDDEQSDIDDSEEDK